MNNFNVKLFTFLKKKNVSPEKLAGEIGITKATVYNWQKKGGKITNEAVACLVSKYNLDPISWFYGNADTIDEQHNEYAANEEAEQLKALVEKLQSENFKLQGQVSLLKEDRDRLETKANTQKHSLFSAMRKYAKVLGQLPRTFNPVGACETIIGLINELGTDLPDEKNIVEFIKKAG